MIFGSIEYTSISTIIYSQITLTIPSLPVSSYLDQNIPITILIGTNSVICSPASCTYRWSSSATPSILSVNPTSISGPTTLTLTGENLQSVNSISVSNVHVTINNHSCNVTSLTNSTIVCNIDHIEVGTYPIVASIDGN